MQKIGCACLLTALALMLSPFPSSAESGRFVQDRFVIGFWCDPPADDQMADRYKQIAEADFTLVLGGLSATTPETIKRQLDLCREHDLKALVTPAPYSMADFCNG